MGDGTSHSAVSASTTGGRRNMAIVSREGTPQLTRFRGSLPPAVARDMLRAVPHPESLMSPLRTIQLITRVTTGLLVAGPLVAQKPKRAPARPHSPPEVAEPHHPAPPAPPRRPGG